MSLFRAIFAFGNGLEVATLGLVFLVVPPSCLRRAFASGGGGKRGAGTRHREARRVLNEREEWGL